MLVLNIISSLQVPALMFPSVPHNFGSCLILPHGLLRMSILWHECPSNLQERLLRGGINLSLQMMKRTRRRMTMLEEVTASPSGSAATDERM